MGNNDESRILELISYMLVSARNLVNETPEYGPLRLLEACDRLIEVFGETGIGSEPLVVLKKSLDEAKTLLMVDKEAFVRALDDLVRSVTSNLFTSSGNGFPEPNP
ncbi:hypothetical protein DRJ24_02035 [Candidatus Acetothermia bacterium]|nr:MAG: hypothetical protein DRJ24_02035 [Candidatus Acetothermia bacterium]HHR85799.1 hypothetical protein [Candidatus Acetothermia bacterium]